MVFPEQPGRFEWSGHRGLRTDRVATDGLPARNHAAALGQQCPGLFDAAPAREAVVCGASQSHDSGVTGAFAPYGLHLAPDEEGRLGIVADTGVAGLDAIVATVAISVAGGGWHRLKLCASPDCRWAFHDTSRSGGGRWCSMEACGNRHKTRTYRRTRAQRRDPRSELR